MSMPTTHEDTATTDALFGAADALAASVEGQTYISTSKLINPLLELWEKAIAVNPEVARPIELLLTAYNSERSLATPDELVDLAQTLRQRASQLSSN